MSLIYISKPTNLYEILVRALEIKEQKRKACIRGLYNITIVWSRYESHRTKYNPDLPEDKRVYLNTPEKITNKLSHLEWEFDLADAILARYGIKPSQAIQ